MFCYKCGKEARLVDGLCRECYVKEHSLITLETHYPVVICKYCDTYLYDVWRQFSYIEDIIDTILDKAAGKRRIRAVDDFGPPSYDPLQVRYKVIPEKETFVVECEVYGRDDPFSDVAITEDHVFVVEPKYTVCPRCSKKYGGYYEAIFQVRREGRPLTADEAQYFIDEVSSLSDAELEKNEMAFIAKVQTRKEGVDFQMGSLKFTKKLARTLLSRYGGSIGESHRLVGFDRQEGKERHRTTIVYRLSKFEPGQYVFYKGSLWKVANAVDKLSLETFDDAATIDFKKVEKEASEGQLEIVGSEFLRKGLIASFNDGAEVLALDTYETYELEAASVPKGLTQGDQVLFLIKDSRCHVVNP
ncbi:hypothetical protein EF808_07700 [archaeon]|nr:MAG: hypothetical protein EF808_07700 [archaeon]